MGNIEKLAELMAEMNAKGRLVEAGWISLRIAAVPQGASEVQINEMRNAFFAGAQHLFTSIMLLMTEGEEPKEADFATLEQIQTELDEFIQLYALTHISPEGRA